MYVHINDVMNLHAYSYSFMCIYIYIIYIYMYVYPYTYTYAYVCLRVPLCKDFILRASLEILFVNPDSANETLNPKPLSPKTPKTLNPKP